MKMEKYLFMFYKKSFAQFPKMFMLTITQWPLLLVLILLVIEIKFVSTWICVCPHTVKF